MRSAFGHGSDEPPCNVRQIHAVLGTIRINATDEIVFLVRHDPRAGKSSVIPRRSVAVVCGFHGAVIVVAAISFGVTVVEAATIIEVQSVDDPVLPLSLIIHCSASGIVITKPHAWLDEDAID